MFLVPTLISPPPTTSFHWFNSIHCYLYSHSTKTFDLRFDLHHGSHRLSAMAGAASASKGNKNRGWGTNKGSGVSSPGGHGPPEACPCPGLMHLSPVRSAWHWG